MLKEEVIVVALRNPSEVLSKCETITRHNVSEIFFRQGEFINNIRLICKSGVIMYKYWIQVFRNYTYKIIQFTNICVNKTYEAIKSLGWENKKIVIVTDDINIDVGNISMKYHNYYGHNAIKEFLKHTRPIPLVKIGVGKPDKQTSLCKFVNDPMSIKDYNIVLKTVKNFNLGKIDQFLTP